MTLKYYAEQARTTAIYPEKNGKLYTLLGVMDELGEVSEKVDQERPDEEIIKELGDVMWYVASAIYEFEFQDIYDLFEESRDMAVLKNNAEKEVAKIAMQQGLKLAGRLKKVLRDENAEFTDTKVAEIYMILRSVLKSLIILVNKMDLDFNKIFEANIDKLFDRKDRGVLKGDGDNR